jgi:plastocyanin
MDRRQLTGFLLVTCSATTAMTACTDDGSDGGETLNGCADGDFIEQAGNAAVAFPSATGLLYTPRCLTIDAGSTVTFSGSFAAHPLRPGTDPGHATAGSPGTPIPSIDDGNTRSITFPAAGTYPYYCLFHYDGGGVPGMSGVVRVK